MKKRIIQIALISLLVFIIVSCASTYAVDFPGVQPDVYTSVPSTDDKNDKDSSSVSSPVASMTDIEYQAYLANLSYMTASQSQLFSDMAAYYNTDDYEGLTPEELIENNIASSRQTVQSNANFVHSETKYTFVTGMIYDVYYSPRNITYIKLEEGESVTNVIMGDPDAWEWGEDTVFVAHTDDESYTYLTFHPYNINIKTDCMVVTDRRTYLFRLISTSKTPQVGISFRYPNSNKGSYRYSLAMTNNVYDTATGLAMGVENLNFNYQIKGSAPWKPTKVYSDTQRTYILFPNSFPTMSEKPIVRLRSNGKDEIVKYTPNGLTYIVPLILSTNELFVLQVGKTEVLVGY